MRDKSIRKNYIFNLTNQLLGIITPFITIPYVSRVLHADGIGVVSYVGAINAYFVLVAGLGIGVYGQRELSYLQNDRYNRSIIFSNLVFISFSSTLVISLFYLFFCWQQKEYNIIYYIFTIQLIAVGLDISWLFVAMEDFLSITIRSILVRVASVISIFMFVDSEADVYIYALILCVSTLLGNVVLWTSFNKYVDLILNRLNPKKYILGIITLFLPTVAISLYTQMDKIMIGYLSNNLYHVGYYEQSMKMIRIALLFVVSLGTVFIPRIGDLLASEKIDEFKIVIKNNLRFVLFSGMFILFEMNALMRYFVPIFFGDGFDEVVYITNILSVDVLLIGINNLTAFQCLIPMRKENLFTFTVVVGAIANFIINLWLIPHYLSIGAACGSIIAELLVTALGLFYVRKFVDVKGLFKDSYNFIVAGLVMFLAIVCMPLVIGNNIVIIAVSIIGGAVVYFIILYLLNDIFFKEFVLIRLLNMVRR